MTNDTRQEISGWHWLTRQPVRLVCKGGIIIQVKKAEVRPPRDIWLAPALFDTQVNGFGGVDFQQDNVTVEQLLDARNKLRAAGCGRFLLTLITDDWKKLTARLRRLRSLRGESSELQTAIAGWHVEGPF